MSILEKNVMQYNYACNLMHFSPKKCEYKTIILFLLTDGKYGEEHQQQHLQHSVSFMPPPMVEYLVPPTQLEHVGPSLVNSLSHSILELRVNSFIFLP